MTTGRGRIALACLRCATRHSKTFECSCWTATPRRPPPAKFANASASWPSSCRASAAASPSKARSCPASRGLFETFVPLLMSFVGADMPEAAYRSVTDRVASLPAFETDRGTLSLRGLVLSHRDWLHLDRARTRHAHQWRELFAVWDIVLCPAMPTTALLHDHAPMDERTIRIDGRSHPYDSQSVWSSVATVCGQPATSMPVGRSGDGLPIGVQAIGPFMARPHAARLRASRREGTRRLRATAVVRCLKARRSRPLHPPTEPCP